MFLLKYKKSISRERQIKISTRYHFTAVREEIRENGDRESKWDRARGKGTHPMVIWGR